jgi:zinc D-Ala-D-Ala carboxypeptidase
MGNLSEHFNHQDFFCKCEECKKNNEYKIHLGLVGVLEYLWTTLNKPVKIKSAFRCEELNEKMGGNRKSFHMRGKAVHIYVEGMPPQELFKLLRTVPEVKGLGYNLEDKTIHVDLRNEPERAEWVKDGIKYIPLTAEKKHVYGLE